MQQRNFSFSFSPLFLRQVCQKGKQIYKRGWMDGRTIKYLMGKKVDGGMDGCTVIYRILLGLYINGVRN